MPRFLVFLPTIRGAAIAEGLAALYKSLEFPSDLVVVHGDAGLAQSGNRIQSSLLDPKLYDVYVKIDDNLLPPEGWQSQVVRAFDLMPELGAVGLDYSHWTGPIGFSRNGVEYMNHVAPVEEIAGLRYRRAQFLTGKFIARRASIAKRSKAIPLRGVPESARRLYVRPRRLDRVRAIMKWFRRAGARELAYQVYEDAFISAEVRRLGFSMAYLVTDPPCQILYPPDPPGYLERKINDTLSAGGPDFRHLLEPGIRRA